MMLGIAAAALLSGGLVACGDDNNGGGAAAPAATASGGAKLSGKVAGAGSSAQDAAQKAWIAGFQSGNPGVTISYNPVGSGGGREQFEGGAVSYAGSDSPFANAAGAPELKKAESQCGGADKFIEVPVYISPIALIYNIDGVSDLTLSPDLIAKIFSGKITKWNDPAIKAENSGVSLPSARISVVHRSDDSGTSHNFTDYMSKTDPKDWTDEPSDTWPIKGQEAAEGTSGVVDAVKNGKDTIGYADASQAGTLGKVNVKVGSKGVAPTPAGASAVVEQSTLDKNDSPNQITYTIARTTKDPSTYPIVLVSYDAACTTYSDKSTASIVKGYLNYVISSAGQQAAASNAGSAPLSDAVRAKAQTAVDAIQG